MKFAGSKRRISLKKIITSRTIALHDYNAKVTIQNAMRMFYAKRSHVDGINFEFIILFFLLFTLRENQLVIFIVP